MIVPGARTSGFRYDPSYRPLTRCHICYSPMVRVQTGVRMPSATYSPSKFSTTVSKRSVTIHVQVTIGLAPAINNLCQSLVLSLLWL